jgi:hypothetical protein
MTFFREVRAHKWTATRALLTGWGVWILSLMWFFPFVEPYFFGISKVPKPYPVSRPVQSPDFSVNHYGASFSLDHFISSVSSFLWMPVGSRMGSTPRGLRDVPTFLFGIVLPLIVAGVCGWLVSRFHRSQQRAAVLLFASSILLTYLLLFAHFAVNVGSSAASAFVGPLSLYIIASVAGILLGGGFLRLFSKRESPEGRPAD